jgi:ABC-type hemin transport system substrate-binding protein
LTGETPPAGPPPARIVSLVPSLSEALFALGLGDRVVGVTDWCVHPAEAVAGLPKVGGTKDPDVDAICTLAPDLVIANHEENTERSVRQLRERGLAVWVTYPQTVRQGAEVLEAIADLGAEPRLRDEVCALVWRAVLDAEGASGEYRPRVFCPIWRDPWMAVGRDTYADDLLRLCGGEPAPGLLSDLARPVDGGRQGHLCGRPAAPVRR